MLVVQVYVKVFEKNTDAFKIATIENAKKSLEEIGIKRFDVLQNSEVPSEFMLTEIYIDEQSAKKHKKSAHYQKWRNTVANMMAEKRYSVKYHLIFPGEVE